MIESASDHCSLSVASRCGLIEAFPLSRWLATFLWCYPQHHAAASLKQALFRVSQQLHASYPQHHAAASLKHQR
jgi:hypothetical protein